MSNPTADPMMATPTARSVLASPRTLAAWALVGYVALAQFFACLLLLAPGGVSFSTRFTAAGFRDLVLMALPVLAVLLAFRAGPVLPGARLLVAVALAEYGIALLFGLVTLLVGAGPVVVHIDSPHDVVAAMQYLVLGAGALALIAVAAYAVARIGLGSGRGRLD
jgi:hypothetical protein